MQATTNNHYIRSLLSLPHHDFVNRVVQDHPELADIHPVLSQSDVTACHVAIRFVPNRMPLLTFKRLCEAVDPAPELSSFLPPIRQDWSGEQVSEWLLASDYIDHGRYEELAGQISGSDFLSGRVLPLLTSEDMERIRLAHARFNQGMYARPFSVGQPVFREVLGVEHPGIRIAAYYAFLEWTVPASLHHRRIDSLALGERAFAQTSLIDVYGEASNFLAYVRKIMASDVSRYVARYGYLGQSSGIGKTKLLNSSISGDQCALLTLYLTCPPSIPTTARRDIAQTLVCLRSQAEAERFLTLTVFKALTSLMARSRHPSRSYSLREAPRCHDLRSMNIDLTGFEEVPSEVLLARQQAITDMLESLAPRVIVVLAVDEAAILTESVIANGAQQNVSRFEVFRNALRALSFSAKMCTIFAGTNTKIGDFLRPLSEAGLTLKTFPPFILTESWDVFSVYQCPPNTIRNWNEYMRSPDHVFHLCNFGRPLWGALMKTGLSEIGIEEPFNGPATFPRLTPNSQEIVGLFEQICQIAVAKLDLADPLSPEDGLCIIGLTARVDWSFGSFGSSLVARRMAFLLDFFQSSNFAEIAYLPEPVLSLAAIKVLRERPCEVLSTAFEASEQTLKDVGAMGEFIARFSLLLCLPTRLSAHYSPVFGSCHGFLHNFLGPSAVEQLSRTTKGRIILGGMVSFSSWHQVEVLDSNPIVNLGYALILHQAIIMPPRYPGVDLVVPVVLQSGKLGSILIQVKSWRKRLDPADISAIAAKMTAPEFVPFRAPVLNVIMNVGSDSRFSAPLTVLDDRTPVVVIDGLATAFHAVYRRYTRMKDVLSRAADFGRYRAMEGRILKYKSVRRNMPKSLEQQVQLEALLVAGNLRPSESLVEVGDQSPSFCVNLEGFLENPVAGEEFYFDGVAPTPVPAANVLRRGARRRV